MVAGTGAGAGEGAGAGVGAPDQEWSRLLLYPGLPGSTGPLGEGPACPRLLQSHWSPVQCAL